MSHCIMYADIADCNKPTCEGCELKNSAKTDCNGECERCQVYACPGHPHFDPSPEVDESLLQWDMAIDASIKITCHICTAAEDCTFNVHEGNGGCGEFNDAFDILYKGDPTDPCDVCKAMRRECIISGPTCARYPEHCSVCNDSGEGNQSGCYKHIGNECLAGRC